MEVKEREVMRALYEQYSESLGALARRIDEVAAEQTRFCSRSEEYKKLYNRKRRLLAMYEDTYRWREMVEAYIKSWEK